MPGLKEALQRVRNKQKNKQDEATSAFNNKILTGMITRQDESCTQINDGARIDTNNSNIKMTH